MTRYSPLLMLLLPSIDVAIVLGLVLALIGLPIWVAIAVALVVALMFGVGLWRMSDGIALRLLGADPVDTDDEPRLTNVVEGLCATFGYTEPELHRVDSPAINAAVVGHSERDAHLIVTSGLVADLDRLEMEAVIARLLSQVKMGIDGATALVAVAKLAGFVGLRDIVLSKALDRGSPIEADLEAVRQTRYPPALASAYEKAADVRPIDSDPAVDHLWLLGTTTGRPRGVIHPPIRDRIDVLREL